ncbi:V/A-type H+-transporting ATPase subunit A [Nitrosomonas aestuarii]|uniref:V-type ATP synthase alpha chain n=1 Tax=Nitrosomonas aestuarii TaxID=52441 RepID=A0A1I4E2R3_9PROT|nr:V-type ATP synthase subunit A [Nitrosomonas aestuarii]SFK98626.1 V/A-type H+-transporting ATPase subunit A [Nitrosomonas aestuarii]HNP51249.1 V-type ATP synthase subunit A [Nitrosomonas nitrosa]
MRRGNVKNIISNLVTVETDYPVAQNEICFIRTNQSDLMGGVIKVAGNHAFVQVYESTRGMKAGDEVSFQGHMLEATLGPGLLSKKFDGLQNDLNKMKSVFLKRGEYTNALEHESEWEFLPLAETGQSVQAGDWLGVVPEKNISHKIMAPFKLKGIFIVKSIVSKGIYKITDSVAVLQDSRGAEHTVSMIQKWPIIIPIKIHEEKPRPFQLLHTGIRLIDTMNPMAEGGTGFIPGPFGSGKTVLQHAIAKQAQADIILFAACGERANEIVEIFTEFSKLEDPNTGGLLMDKTIIIANTSNMPVAAREASVYTAMTMAEYYRAMGLKVLLLADSTSRWAQALREMSNRLEELPGTDAFPMDLSAIISNFYARAGFVKLRNEEHGSITFLGTVSPAGGNLKEPVTEATKKVARCYYALSQQRADSKRYPAIDPVDSYSKYLEYLELQRTLGKQLGNSWVDTVIEAKDILLKGKEAYEQINILGDDSVPLEYHEKYWKSELIDFVILQQDAFDAIDSYTSLERQRYMLCAVMDVCHIEFDFQLFDEIAPYFKKIIDKLKQMNYSEFQSNEFNQYLEALGKLINQKKAKEYGPSI